VAGPAPGAIDGHDRQAGAGHQAGEIAGLVGDLQDGPPFWLQPPPELPAADRQARAARGRALATAGLVAAGPMTRLVRLSAVIGCSDVVLCGEAVRSHLGREPPVSRSGVWMDVRDEVVTVSLLATGLSRGG
jgi:hypothetical protein